MYLYIVLHVGFCLGMNLQCEYFEHICLVCVYEVIFSLSVFICIVRMFIFFCQDPAEYMFVFMQACL
jgi:hypothetical protein